MANIPLISIVDDDPSVRRALSRLCRSAGYLVEEFASAEEFLLADSVKTADGAQTTDCLVLDVHLPGQNGLQLQSTLVAANKTFSIVFMTAFENEQARTQALESGAVEFLRKPLDSERLLGAIQRGISESE